MDKTFLDTKISKKSQLRIIVGLLCVVILYNILINLVNTISADSMRLQNLFFNLSNALIFLYLYKYIRYDLKLKLLFAFVGIEVLINIYYVVVILYKLIQGMGPGDTVFGSYEQSYQYAVVMSLLRLVSIIGIAIQLFINDFFVKKIKVVIQLLGVSFLLQLIGPIGMVPLIGMFDGTTVEFSVIDNIYRFTNLFFIIIPYIGMVCLYVLALDQDYTDVSTEEKL